MKKPFRPRRLLPVLLVLLLAVIGGISMVNAKYTRTYTHTGTLVFKTSLAEDVRLLEHKADRLENGSYAPNKETDPVKENEYLLIPGLDIEKDPYILIQEKTPVRAYLYVEIVDTTDTYEQEGETLPLITYDVADHWKATTDRTPAHDGNVYVYTGDQETAMILTNENAPTGEIYILKDNKITVSQHIRSFGNHAAGDAGLLEFYVYLVETTKK